MKVYSPCSENAVVLSILVVQRRNRVMWCFKAGMSLVFLGGCFFTFEATFSEAVSILVFVASVTVVLGDALVAASCVKTLVESIRQRRWEGIPIVIAVAVIVTMLNMIPLWETRRIPPREKLGAIVIMLMGTAYIFNLLWKKLPPERQRT